jgi:restriction system protein
MKLKMARNSLFAVLLRSAWWVSAVVGGVLALVALALLPAGYKVAGALGAMPFFVISFIAARRQWRLPSAAQVEQAAAELATLSWPQFASRLEAAFVRDGHGVQRVEGAPSHDFVLDGKGRAMLVAARRWKSARLGIEALREAHEAPDALLITLAELSDSARAYAVAQHIAVWQAAELAQALRPR